MSKMKAVKFTYDWDTFVKTMKKSGHLHTTKYLDFCKEDGEVIFGNSRESRQLDNNNIAKVFGGIMGHYSHRGNGNKWNPPRVKFVFDRRKSKAPVKVEIWKEILTWDEVEEVFKRHNAGFGEEFNPKVLSAVVVYSPRQSHWRRDLWNCDFLDRAYRFTSAEEIFREKDPSMGLIRHPYCTLTSLRPREKGGECLLRPDWSWRDDYCYIEKTTKED